MTSSGADQKNPDRLMALSDGIFAIAMTLLVLDIHVTSDLDTAGFRQMLHDLLPKIGAYALSFTILAGLWRDQRKILQLARRVDALTLRLSLAGLGVIALLPFPTTLLSEYASQPLAVAGYAGTIIVIDLLLLAVFLSIWRRPHMAYPAPAHVSRKIVADLATNVLVFGATVPIAFISPAAAMWSWLALIPVKLVLWKSQRVHAATGD